ncbi:hypothetical protein GTQ40_16315 [Flavobacteriaceae bacterium R38]|nr:hypothetical protein [Flavobacteriaceae bacterium R38]
MKFKFLILISSLLLVSLTSREVFSTQPLECITSEVEEETYVNLVTSITDEVTIEDGGNFGNGVLTQQYTKILHVDIPVRLSIGVFSDVVNTIKIPCYIFYSRLKIAC